MTQEQLNILLEFWKRQLGLDAWDITATFHSHRELGGNTGQGYIRAVFESADIMILDPSDRVASFRDDGDPEVDLVHELVHVRLWSIDPEETDGILHTCRETAVEKIARALVSIKRSGLGVA